MHTTRKQCLAWLIAGLAALATGCTTTAMKGTPLYTGEDEHRTGPAEDRINAWPLAYYRNPTLSVLWPIFELSDDHYAIRPLWSVYGTDRSDSRRIYSFAWPLASFDQIGDHNWIGPVYWSKEDAAVFPLYWHAGKPYQGSYGYDALFPLYIYDKDGNSTDLHLMWPLFRNYAGPDRQITRLWPVYGTKSSTGRQSSWYAWPLGWTWNRNNGERYGHALFPVYGFEHNPQGNQFVSLPWSMGNDGKTSWWLAFPLAYREKGENRGAFFTLPYWSAWQEESSWWMVPPVAYHASNPNGSATYSPVYLSKRQGDSSWWMVPPIAYRAQDPKETALYTLLYLGKKQANGASWWCVPPALALGRQDADGNRAFFSPLYSAGKQGDNAWQTLFPLYYYRHDPTSHSFATLLGGWERGESSFETAIFPLLSGYRKSADSKELFLLGGLADFKATATRKEQYVFPLYYYRSDPRLFLSLLYAKGGDEGRRWQTLIPFYYYQQKPDGFTLHTPLVSRTKDANHATTGVHPMLYKQDTDGAQRDTSALLGLTQFRRGPERNTSLVFPLYYADAEKEMKLSPLWMQWGKPDNRTTVLPLALSGYSREGEQRKLALLLGLYGQRWGGSQKPTSHLFPLYAHRQNDYFYTPLVGWKRGEQHSRHLTYVATPLAGFYGNQYRGGYFWPFYDHERRVDSTDYDGDFLLLGDYYRRGRESGSSFFLLWDYNNYGSREDMADAEYARAGKQWWVLPTFWYRNIQTRRPIQPVPVTTAGDQPATPPTPLPGNLDTDFSAGFWPLFMAKETCSTTPAGELFRSDSSGNLLWLLYDYKHEQHPLPEGRTNDYTRRRILWRLWHYERLNGEVAVDMPAITWDSKPDGYRQFSFFWRFIRVEKEANGTNLDLLFIPLKRAG